MAVLCIFLGSGKFHEEHKVSVYAAGTGTKSLAFGIVGRGL